MLSPTASRSAASYGLCACHTCGLVCRSPSTSTGTCCPRCGDTLHTRKPASINKSWAYLSAAYILFLPANLLPVMETGSLFGSQADTILSGVIYLWTSGSWPLAILVFFASIVVPLVKLLAMTYLLLSVQLRKSSSPLRRAKLYRFLEFIGRWSMLDIYVITILVALVRIQSFATVVAGPGAVAFGAVVVLTMLAAMAFDARLIWDAQ